jgi:hypothetical protein
VHSRRLGDGQFRSPILLRSARIYHMVVAPDGLAQFSIFLQPSLEAVKIDHSSKVTQVVSTELHSDFHLVVSSTATDISKIQTATKGASFVVKAFLMRGSAPEVSAWVYAVAASTCLRFDNLHSLRLICGADPGTNGDDSLIDLLIPAAC